MASTITAGNATNGLALSCDNTGILELKTGTGSGTTGLTIDASQVASFAGNVGIGTSSPLSVFDVVVGASGARRLLVNYDDTIITVKGANNTAAPETLRLVADNIRFNTGTTDSGTERARIDSSGELLVGKTSTDDTITGIKLGTSGTSNAFTVASGASWALMCNRQGDDGTLIQFRQANASEGSISVSGNTVSYNAFAGSHWSQLQDGSKPKILRGTVMESIDELVQWPDEPTTERLCRSKVSDTAGSKRVYGVFMCWDEDWTATNDMLVTSLGAFVCRVNAGVTVQMGDLLESNGDGTARVQADDIIRSSTIGKVTGTAKTHEYDDGSYCVPTVLYCG